MDLEHLSVLRELADRGSITNVAVALHRSPSAISQQLRTLQRQMGVVLVERVGRGVRLTEAGRTLVDSSVRIATAVAEAEATWSAYRGGTAGVVRVAFFPSAAELLLPGLLTRMAAHPGIEVLFSDRDVAQDQFAGLAAEFDIVVAHRSDDSSNRRPGALTVVPLMREPLDVALPLDHPLAGNAAVTVDQIIAENWIGVDDGFPIDRALQTMATQAGVPTTIAHRSNHLSVIESLVAAGHGIALMPRYTTQDRARGRFALVPITGVRAGRHIEALLRPDRAPRPAVRIVLDELTAHAVSQIGNIHRLG